MSEEDENHEWELRLVWRYKNDWHASRQYSAFADIDVWGDPECTEKFVQRRRKRDHLDPTPCEGIEHPVWRDWEASSDPDIQGVLMAKGMPFRSLEK